MEIVRILSLSTVFVQSVGSVHSPLPFSAFSSRANRLENISEFSLVNVVFRRFLNALANASEGCGWLAFAREAEGRIELLGVFVRASTKAC